MTENPNFVKLGAFVLVSAMLMVGAVILFGSGILAEEKIYFETYFTESVHGLSRGSPVEENGVHLGTVERISLLRDDYPLPYDESGLSGYERYVRVTWSVSQENWPQMATEKWKDRIAALTDEGMRLRLAFNLLTGQAYLEATYLDPTQPPPVLPVGWEPDYLYIPSAPSTLITLQEAIGRILHKLEQLDFKQMETGVNQLLTEITNAVRDANIKELRGRIDTLALTATQTIQDANIPALSREIHRLAAEARQTNRHVKALLVDSDVDLDKNNIPELIAQINQTISRLDQILATESPKVDSVLENLRLVILKLRHLIDYLSKNPSAAIWSQPPSDTEMKK